MTLRFAQGLLIGAALLIASGLPGCREQKKTPATPPADTTQAASHATTSYIVTTPANMLVFVHAVKDYLRWKPAYHAHDSARQAYGLHNYVIGRGLQDSNLIMVALKADDLARAKQFAGSAGLKKAMREAGVIGAPESYVLTATWQDTSAIVPVPRVITNLHVNNWDAWWQHFQSGEEERLAHGLKARLVGHDPDDKTKVSIVSAVTDTAKAFAYFKSDLLKTRMKDGGVVGEPRRRLFQLVQRY